MKVKEPCGSVCNLDQKQSPGGGIMIGYNLTDKEPNAQYVVAEAFSGDYEIEVVRIFGQPLGNRARLQAFSKTLAARHQQTITSIWEIIRLDQNEPIKITLKDGRRTELATVSPAATERPEAVREEQQASQIRSRTLTNTVANPTYLPSATGPCAAKRGDALGGARVPTVSSLAAKDSKNKAVPTTVAQNAFIPTGGGGVQMTTQMRVSADQRNVDMVIRPFFDSINAATNRPAINLSVIPGGGPN